MYTGWINSKEYFIAYSIMINAAQHQGLCTYQEIAQAIGIATAGSYMGNIVASIIGQVSKNELEQGRPMLSCIVVGVGNRIGSGFFAWAKELGVLKEGEDEHTFLALERKKVYEEWKIKYKTTKGK